MIKHGDTVYWAVDKLDEDGNEITVIAAAFANEEENEETFTVWHNWWAYGSMRPGKDIFSTRKEAIEKCIESNNIRIRELEDELEFCKRKRLKLESML